MKDPYPLRSLRRLRRVEEDGARRALAEAQRRVEASRARVEESERLLAQHRVETAAQEAALGPPRRGDVLTQAAAYGRRRGREEGALAERAQAARSEVDDAERALRRAQETAADAGAARRRVDDHHATWSERAAREAGERADEDAAERDANLLEEERGA